MADRQLLGEPDASAGRGWPLWPAAAHGARWPPSCPTRRTQVRGELAPVVAELAGDVGGRAPAPPLVDAGLVAPHWPRAVGPGRRRRSSSWSSTRSWPRRASTDPTSAIGAWALPTIIASGTPEQHERWVDPTLLGELAWCQLFSEPGAGSDLASLTTRADADRGRLAADRPEGVDVHGPRGRLGHLPGPDRSRRRPSTRASPTSSSTCTRDGLDIRPLRELTGAAMFNEVFLDDVFVPDDCVIGEVNGGWGLRPHDPGQRAGVDVVGRHLRHRRRVAAAPGRDAQATPSRPAMTVGWGGCWPRPSRSG